MFGELFNQLSHVKFEIAQSKGHEVFDCFLLPETSNLAIISPPEIHLLLSSALLISALCSALLPPPSSLLSPPLDTLIFLFSYSHSHHSLLATSTFTLAHRCLQSNPDLTTCYFNMCHRYLIFCPEAIHPPCSLLAHHLIPGHRPSTILSNYSTGPSSHLCFYPDEIFNFQLALVTVMMREKYPVQVKVRCLPFLLPPPFIFLSLHMMRLTCRLC